MTQQRTAARELISHRLTEISRALTYARSLTDVMELTVDCATELLKAPRAVLMLNGEDGLLRIRAARGLEGRDLDQFREPLDENLLVRLTGLFGPSAREGFLGVPLVVQGAVTGLLAVHFTPGRAATAEDEWLLSALADQTAIALESARNDDVRHLLEDRLGQLQREQEGKDRAIEILSHDLRTPLSAVMGYAGLMSSEVLGPINERQRNTLQRMRVVCNHMEAVLSNVLEMARLKGGRFVVASEPVDVTDVVASAIDVVRPSAELAEITLSVTGPAGVTIQSDDARLRLVLIQLLDNAIKYSPENCRVSVQHSVVKMQAKAWLQIEVADEGPGIEPEHQHDIFEPYVRRDGVTERARSGVGLGLAIAHGIVERLGGTLSVASTPGQGATFRMQLPA
jgi:sigma-B regulation protein RsbU (phosphoserine phosphatase)